MLLNWSWTLDFGVRLLKSLNDVRTKCLQERRILVGGLVAQCESKMQYLRSTSCHPLAFHRQTIYVTVPGLRALMIYHLVSSMSIKEAGCSSMAVLNITHAHQLDFQKTCKATSPVEQACQTIKGPFQRIIAQANLQTTSTTRHWPLAYFFEDEASLRYNPGFLRGIRDLRRPCSMARQLTTLYWWSHHWQTYGHGQHTAANRSTLQWLLR